MALVDVADRVVLADTFPCRRKSTQKRALLRTPQGRQWISVPLERGKHRRSIREAKIAWEPRWMHRHWHALEYNYRTTPFFEFYEPSLRPFFDEKWEYLGALACASVRLLAEWLGIDTPIEQASEMEGAPATVRDIHAACGGALLVGADTIQTEAGPAGPVAVAHLGALRYRQNFEGFLPGMSALDLLFNGGPEALTMLRAATRVNGRPRAFAEARGSATSDQVDPAASKHVRPESRVG